MILETIIINYEKYKNKVIISVTNMELHKIKDIEVYNINTKDYPDFVDAYISYATCDNIELTDEELDELNENRDFVYEQVIKHVF